MTQEMPAVLMAMGACSREEPQPKLLLGHDDVAVLYLPANSRSMSSMQWAASSLGSEVLRYLAGMMTSVSTLSPYLMDNSSR